jgi:intein-encoded DNA endonuclease-like protein
METRVTQMIGTLQTVGVAVMEILEEIREEVAIQIMIPHIIILINREDRIDKVEVLT